MTLDTNILIAYLNGERKVVDFVLEQKVTGRALFISPVTVAELLSLSDLSKNELVRIKEFVGNFISIPVDNTLAESAALMRRLYKLSLPDAVIAATALSQQSPLITRDHGFRKVRELLFVEL